MDTVSQFGMSAEQYQQIAADPWKWYVFHIFVVSALKESAPWLVVLLLGMAAAAIYRRRCPTVARRVLIGCVGLLLVALVEALFFWVWTILDPDPIRPWRPARRWPVGRFSDATSLVWVVVTMTARASFLWVLVSAVRHDRVGRYEGETE